MFVCLLLWLLVGNVWLRLVGDVWLLVGDVWLLFGDVWLLVAVTLFIVSGTFGGGSGAANLKLKRQCVSSCVAIYKKKLQVPSDFATIM